MSTSNPSDPRLLLPEWLRDGDLPASLEVPETQAPVESIAPVQALPVDVTAVGPSVPFSDRLSLDTRLDPGLLVSAAHLPKWLGGLALIFISSELDEVVRLSQRVVVMRDRRKIAELDNENHVDVDDIVALIAKEGAA